MPFSLMRLSVRLSQSIPQLIPMSSFTFVASAYPDRLQKSKIQKWAYNELCLAALLYRRMLLGTWTVP